MFNWFNKKEKKKHSFQITIEGINPNTDNEFLFYDFVARAYPPRLENWYDKVKKDKIKFKPHYESAIKEKIKSGKFTNPHNFPEYFNNEFDLIGFHFLRGTDNDLSAFQIGTCFILNEKIAYSPKYNFQPPKSILHQKEFKEALKLFEIDPESIIDFSFEDVWNSLDLKVSFNNNLLVCWNQEIDILKKILQQNHISDYKLKFIRIRKIAQENNLPDLIDNLLKHFESELNLENDLSLIAPTLALEFEDMGINLNDYIEYYKPDNELSPDEKADLNFNQNKINSNTFNSKQPSLGIRNENFDIIREYSISKEELHKIKIAEQSFIFTGELTTDRDIAKNFIIDNGGLIKPKISSKVDFVIIGVDFGWSKIQKVQDFNTKKNCKIRFMTNSDFEYLIDKYAT